MSETDQSAVMMLDAESGLKDNLRDRWPGWVARLRMGKLADDECRRLADHIEGYFNSSRGNPVGSKKPTFKAEVQSEMDRLIEEGHPKHGAKTAAYKIVADRHGLDLNALRMRINRAREKSQKASR